MTFLVKLTSGDVVDIPDVCKVEITEEGRLILLCDRTGLLGGFAAGTWVYVIRQS